MTSSKSSPLDAAGAAARAAASRQWDQVPPPHGRPVNLVGELAAAGVAKERIAERSGLGRSSCYRILRGQVRPLPESRRLIVLAAESLLGRPLGCPPDPAVEWFSPGTDADARRWRAYLAQRGGRPGVAAHRPLETVFTRLDARRPFMWHSRPRLCGSQSQPRAAVPHSQPEERPMLLPADCLKYFGLERDPWGPPEQDGTGLYESRSFKENKALLVAAAEGQGFACIAGRIGSGKSLLLAATLAELARRGRFAGAICWLRTLDREHATARHILEALVADLAGSAEQPKRGNEALTRQVIRIVLDLQERSPQRCPLLVIDEAQSLSRDAMRALKRVREATQIGFKPGLGVLMAGQTDSDPDVMDLLKRSDLEEVRARVLLIRLDGMDRRELGDYCRGKLRRAGLSDGVELIEPAALDAIDRAWEHNCLALNVDSLLVRSMLAGWRNRVKPLDAEVVQGSI